MILNICLKSLVLELVNEKGVYPYEYIDSFKKFSENKLPDKSEFFSSFKDECISEKDYQRANNIWNVLRINTMGDYHDLYLKTDVLLLADAFEKSWIKLGCNAKNAWSRIRTYFRY